MAHSARAGAASSPPASKRGLSRLGAAKALRFSWPYVTVLLPELASLTCSHVQHKQNPRLRGVCQAEHVFLFSLLSRIVTALLHHLQVTGVFLRLEIQKNPHLSPPDCCLCCVCRHQAGPLWALRSMSPTSLPSWKAAAGRDSHFLRKQGKTEVSHRVHRCFPRTYA